MRSWALAFVLFKYVKCEAGKACICFWAVRLDKNSEPKEVFTAPIQELAGHSSPLWLPRFAHVWTPKQQADHIGGIRTWKDWYLHVPFPSSSRWECLQLQTRDVWCSWFERARVVWVLGRWRWALVVMLCPSADLGFVLWSQTQANNPPVTKPKEMQS